MIEVIILICSIIIIFIILKTANLKTANLKTDSTEKFDDYLTSCPGGYNLMYKDNGDMICYSGTIDNPDASVIANKCISSSQCVLNGPGTRDVPNCIDAILGYYAEESKQCPTSMPSYFQDNAIKGCTKGRLNNTFTGPATPQQPKCKIYKGPLNKSSKDSCYNTKMLDEAECFGENCTKQIIIPFPGYPALIQIQFTDPNKMIRSAYTRASIIQYLDVIMPDWKTSGRSIDINKSLQVAEVAKEYYFGSRVNVTN